MRVANEGSILKCSLKMLYIYVFLVAPLTTGHMSQSDTDQHQGRVSVRESSHHPSAASDFSVEPFNDIIGADSHPVLGGKITVSQRLFNVVISLLEFHVAQLPNDYTDYIL